MLFPTPARALTLLMLALFQIASVSASPMPQALPLDLVTDLASTAAGSGSGSLAPVHSNANTNNAVASALLSSSSSAAQPAANTPTDNVKHTSGSPLDLESLPLLGSLDSAAPLGEGNAASVHNGNSASASASGESAGEAHPSGPLSLLGRRAVYGAAPRAGAASIGIPASNAAYTMEGDWEDGATHSKLSMPVGRAERFRARWMRRASLGLGSV